MSKITFAILLLLFVLLPWGPSGEQTCDAKDPCTEVIAKLAKGEALTEKSLTGMGFKIAKVNNFERGIVRPLSLAEWEKAQGRLSSSMEGFAKESRNMRSPGPGYAPPTAVVKISKDGKHIEGTRYMVRTINGERRIFRFQFRESITHDGKNVSHYASVNIKEMKSPGEEGALIAYGDSPHIDRLGSKWFHGHDGASKAVAGEIPAQGYTQSALENMYRWASNFIETTIRVP